MHNWVVFTGRNSLCEGKEFTSALKQRQRGIALRKRVSKKPEEKSAENRSRHDRARDSPHVD